jgi:hypothetical protein
LAQATGVRGARVSAAGAAQADDNALAQRHAAQEPRRGSARAGEAQQAREAEQGDGRRRGQDRELHAEGAEEGQRGERQLELGLDKARADLREGAEGLQLPEEAEFRGRCEHQRRRRHPDRAQGSPESAKVRARRTGKDLPGCERVRAPPASRLSPLASRLSPLATRFIISHKQALSSTTTSYE